MSRGIYGNLICHNESVADVCRAIESIFPICNPDPILVVHDGSTQPLIDWLEARAEIYNLKIWQNSFTTLREQRQFILSKVPLNNWVICLDSDEAYSQATTRELRDCLLYKLSQKHYDTAREGNIPLCVSIPVMNLVQDQIHYDSEGIYHQQKVFYYEKGLRWNFAPYFTHISYSTKELSFERGDDTTVYSVVGPPTWIIKHFARLSPERLKWRAEHINDPKYGNYEAMAWQKETPKIVELEVEKW